VCYYGNIELGLAYIQYPTIEPMGRANFGFVVTEDRSRLWSRPPWLVQSSILIGTILVESSKLVEFCRNRQSANRSTSSKSFNILFRQRQKNTATMTGYYGIQPSCVIRYASALASSAYLIQDKTATDVLAKVNHGTISSNQATPSNSSDLFRTNTAWGKGLPEKRDAHYGGTTFVQHSSTSSTIHYVQNSTGMEL
jgi:hypothetical protein